jgi:hypothetical protein
MAHQRRSRAACPQSARGKSSWHGASRWRWSNNPNPGGRIPRGIVRRAGTLNPSPRQTRPWHARWSEGAVAPPRQLGADPLLGGADLVRHPRPPPLPDPERLDPPPIGLALGAVKVGRSTPIARHAADTLPNSSAGVNKRSRKPNGTSSSDRRLLPRLVVVTRKLSRKADAPLPAGTGAPLQINAALANQAPRKRAPLSQQPPG